MTRTFDEKRVWQLDRQTFDRSVELLASTIGRQTGLDLVVGIARGGQEPARLLAAHLDVQMRMVGARHNRSDRIRSDMDELVNVDMPSIASVPPVDHILLVDDICGSGRTLLMVRRYLMHFQPSAKVMTVTLCRNAGSVFVPDEWVWTVRDWVVFPWEVTPDDICLDVLPRPIRTRMLI
jgi:hypoxanthine phosphoribosyltransferase